MAQGQTPEEGVDLLFSGLTDEEIASAFDAGVDIAPAKLAPSRAARELSRALGARHIEVIAHWASQKMRGTRGDGSAERLRRVIVDARRLAVEMDEVDLIEAYRVLDGIVDAFAIAGTAAARRRVAKRLREWTLDFAALLGGDAGKSLRELVVFKRGAFPLLERLRAIRGVGPRCLERLYGAGLNTTDSLSEADPAELVDLVGLRPALAAEIVRVSREFAEAERRETVTALNEMTAEVARILRHAKADGDSLDLAFLNEIQRAIAALKEVVDAPESHERGG